MLVNKSCTGLFVDVRNYLYCSSAEEHQVFATELNRVAGKGCPGPVSNMLDHPHGIFVTTKFSLYVSDTHNNRIQRFDPGQTSALTVAGSGARVYFILNRPTGVVLDADENLFIVDSGNHRILRFVSDTFQCLFGCSGNRGSSASDLNQPRTMAFDQEGHIFVTDARNNRIQTFRLIQNSCGRSTFILVFTIEGSFVRFYCTVTSRRWKKPLTTKTFSNHSSMTGYSRLFSCSLPLWCSTQLRSVHIVKRLVTMLHGYLCDRLNIECSRKCSERL